MKGRVVWIALAALIGAAIVVDWLSPALVGLGPAALLIGLGGLLIWRTAQEVEPAFEGPERHRPWLQTSGWFLVAVGIVGVLVSLLTLVGG